MQGTVKQDMKTDKDKGSPILEMSVESQADPSQPAVDVIGGGDDGGRKGTCPPPKKKNWEKIFFGQMSCTVKPRYLAPR